MPDYDHECYECGYNWEDTYSINKEPPTICPKCGGKARRIISGVPSCKVVLGRRELKEHIKEERKKIRQQVKSDENFRANLMGEESYHDTQTNIDKIDNELKRI